MADHKNKKQNETVDAGLCGNEKIEEAIAALQQPSRCGKTHRTGIKKENW